MFEQTFVTGQTARKPGPLAASFAVQSAFVALIVTIPLVQTAHLAWTPPAPLLFVPPRPVVVELMKPLPQTPRQASPIRAIFRPSFVAPSRIPARIVTTPDPDPASILQTSAYSQSTTPFDSALTGIALPPAAPASKPPAPAPTREAPKTSSLKVSAGVQAAKLIRQVRPVYPPLARAARISGTVRLQAVIAADGAIRDLQLISGPPLLVAAALDAVKRWAYEPTLLSGKPVEVITSIDVHFLLNP